MLQGKKINHHTLRKACWLNPMITKIKQKNKTRYRIKTQFMGTNYQCKKVNRALNVVNHHFLPHFSFKIIKKIVHTLI